MARKVDGVTEEQARWSPVPSGTSLLWLLKHVGKAEAIWVLDRFAGMEVDGELLGDQLDPNDDVPTVTARNRRIWALVDDVVAANNLDTICAGEDDEPNPDLRWVLAHLVEDIARHAGHADIVRELIDGQVGR